MRKDKNKAIKLRKQGKSYRDIKRELDVPLSTLSEWFSGQDWSESVAKKLIKKNRRESIVRIKKLNKIRGDNLLKVYGEAENEARQDWKELRYHPLFIAGIMLYWGEGDKVSKNGFRIANSDPQLVHLFVKFLRDACGIDESRIKASLLLYPDHKEQKVKSFWQKNAGLSNIVFTKSHNVLGRSGKKRTTEYGVCTVSVSSSYLKKKMLIWLTEFPEEMLKDSYYKRV